MQYRYPVDLTADEAGRILAVFPDLTGAATDGATREEALAEAADCLEEALAAAIAAGEDIPPPSPARGRPVVAPGVLIAAKAALYDAMRRQGIGKSDLARRLGIDEAVARRMLDPKHATRIDRMEAALAALGRRAVLSVEAA